MAGVSIATVSNYLNNTKPVSKAASAKIRTAVEALNYSQNFSAKTLRGQRYTEIAVVLPNFTDPYYIQIYQGIESAIQGTEYFLSLAFSYDIPEVEESVVKNILKKQLCGLIIVSCQPDSWKFYYSNFAKAGKPIVMIDRRIKGLEANIVSFDNYSVIKGLTEKLLRGGFTHPCLLVGPLSFDCEENSSNGFIDACKETGITSDQYKIVQTALNKENAFRHTLKVLRSSVPDCFIATSESTASGIIEGLNLLGFGKIPVVTIGEEHWNQKTHSFAAFSAPRPAIKMGRTAANLLKQDLQHPMRENEIVIFDDNIEKTVEALKVKKADIPSALLADYSVKDKLKILMLDSPIVKTFTGLVKNFEDSAGIGTEVSILPHQNLYDEICKGRHDVIMYDIPWLPELASSGILSDITECVNTIDTDMFFPDILTHFSHFHGRYYGLPFMYAPQMFYYRKDLFEDPTMAALFESHFGTKLKPPITLKEFNAMAEFFTTMTDKIEYGASVSAAYNECLAPELHLRLQAYGSDIFDRAGHVVFDNPQTLKAFINFKKLLKFAKPDYLQSDDVSIVNDFLHGSTAMLITYPAFLIDVSDLRKNNLTGSIGYSLIPGRTPILGGWSFGIESSSARKEEAFEFIRWTCSRKISNYFSMMGGQTAVTRTYTNDELVKLYPWLTKYYDAYSYTKPIVMPELSNGKIISADSVDNIICQWTYKLIADELDVQSTIKHIHKDLEQLMASYEG